MPRISSFLLCIFLTVSCEHLFAQKDSSHPSPKRAARINPFARQDTSKKYNPRVAIVRSALIPGWGQATNKKYWKIPIVYAAIGITTGIFLHNIKQYRTARNAYRLAIDTIPSNDYLIPEPYYSFRFQPDVIRNFRNQVRQNVDYSALFIIIFWGLNVVDAAVDAHLKTFDVGDNLSFQLKPGYSPVANTNGISLVMNIGKNHSSKHVMPE